MEAPIEHRRELLARGFTDGELRRRLRTRELVAVRRGSYLAVDAVPQATDARHRLRVRAARRDVAPDAVTSHVSAAVMHGLQAGGGTAPAGLHVHATPLDPDERTEVRGVVVTSPGRTVVDLARSVPFEQAVCIADAALFQRLVTRLDLDAALARSAHRPGAPAVRRVVAFANGLSESVGESRSREALLRAGLPAPLLQWEVFSGTGRWLGRADFGWPERRTVGEFDGRVKYGRLLRPGQEAGDAVFEEKVREDAIRDQDLRVVRWTWFELDAFAPVAERLRRAFG